MAHAANNGLGTLYMNGVVQTFGRIHDEDGLLRLVTTGELWGYVQDQLIGHIDLVAMQAHNARFDAAHPRRKLMQVVYQRRGVR